jgi:hypothetical protein
MRGYPKHIATVQDVKNLLSMPEFKERVLKDLARIYNLKDDKVVKAIDDPDAPDFVPGADPHSFKEIANPMPLWKQKGFETKGAILALIQKNGGKIDD